MDKVEKLIQLREKTGCGIGSCSRALIDCNMDIKWAEEYLRVLSQPVARYKIVNGDRRAFEKQDYLDLAFKQKEDRG